MTRTTTEQSTSAPVEAFYPAHAERERLDDYLTRELARAQARLEQGSTIPTIDIAQFRSQLQTFDFADPQPLPALLDWSIAILEHGVNHMTHPRYFGLFNPSPTFPSQCADRIVNAFNPQLASAVTAPTATALEAHVINAVARRAGFPSDAGGHFTSGGSEANYTALICALTRAHPGFVTDGARAFAGPPVFYTSKECHRSWVKIGHQAGIGRSAARLVPTDGTGRMSMPALAAAIDADIASGCVPILIVASAGTTNVGMIDPLHACADLAERHALWFHVDAAWGGAIVASDRYRHVVSGLERADSATIDAHKWFSTTMACGMFIVRDTHAPTRAFDVAASYMPSHEASVDPYMNSVQWSRRFVGLRLFLSLATGGWAGHARHIERAISQAQHIAAKLVGRGWSVVNDSPLAVVAVVPPAGTSTPARIVERVLKSGRAWVSLAKYEDQDVVRICVTHGETSAEDLEILVDALVTAAT